MANRHFGFLVGVALIIGRLLAETKLSNRGLGYLVIQVYALFDMPRLRVELSPCEPDHPVDPR